MYVGLTALDYIGLPFLYHSSKCQTQMKEVKELPAQERNGQLVLVNNGQVVTTSLIVAEFFGKEHYRVLRAIDQLECSKEFRAANFGVSSYTKKNGNVTKEYPMYYLTRDGFTFLAMGFTGKVAAKFKEDYIEAFNRMERTIRDTADQQAKAILKETITDLNKRMRKSIEVGRRRHGKQYGPAGEMVATIPFHDDLDFNDNLRLVMAYHKNAMLDGFFFASESKRLEGEIQALRQAVARFTDEMATRLKL